MTSADNVAAARTELGLPASTATTSSPPVAAPAAASPTAPVLQDPGLAAAEWSWDEARLDRWLTEPHDVVPDTYMMYKQADPAIRAAIIKYLLSQK